MGMGTRQETAGLLYGILGMVTWGLVPVLGHSFAVTMDPLLFGGLATLAGCVPLIGILRRQGISSEVWAPEYRKPLLLIGLLTGLSTAMFFVGTSLTSGMHSGLLLQLEPFYSMVLAAVLLGEVVLAQEAAAASLMVLGAAVVMHRGGGAWNAGDILIALSPILQQLSHVVTKGIIGRVSSPTVIPAARLLYSGLFVTGLAVVRDPAVLRQLAVPANLAGILAFGLVFRALDCWLWYAAIARIPLSRASALIPLSVLISFSGSIAILGERAHGRQIAGLLLILGGMAWFSRIQLKRPAPAADPGQNLKPDLAAARG